MDQLAQNDRRFLEAAAITGENRLEFLTLLCGVLQGSLFGALDRLEGSGLVDSNGQSLRWRRPWMSLAVKQQCTTGRRLQVVDQFRGAAPGTGTLSIRPLKPTTSSGFADMLTASERRVVEVIVKGTSVKQAAEHLSLSDRTIGSHLQSAYRKLGVRSRSELAALVLTQNPL
jgi:DNA-binding CsgD family transcriptional regulator